RLWVNGTQVINNWTDHSPATNTSGNVSLSAGQRVAIRLEYYENGGGAVMQLRWRRPGQSSYVAIPAASLNAP
ncbi:MAG: PA14 domain-containing protein, partial [Rubrivivax sp.]